MKSVPASSMHSRRRGFALIIAIVVTVLSTGIVVGLVRHMIERTRQAERQLWTLQAEMMADAIEHEIRRSLRSDSDFAAEDWNPPLPGSSGPLGVATIVRGGSSEHPAYHIEVRVPADEIVPAIMMRDITE